MKREARTTRGEGWQHVKWHMKQVDVGLLQRPCTHNAGVWGLLLGASKPGGSTHLDDGLEAALGCTHAKHPNEQQDCQLGRHRAAGAETGPAGQAGLEQVVRCSTAHRMPFATYVRSKAHDSALSRTQLHRKDECHPLIHPQE